MKLLKTMAAGAVTCAALLLAGCGGGGGDGGIGGSGATAGTMKVSMTDAPSCGYDHVFVTVNKVRVHQSADASDAEGGAGGWVDVPLARPQRVDLLTLTNGVLFPLGETVLPAGKYQQMRLVLADNTVAAPWANSVQPTGGAEVPLDTPSGQQSGLKLNMNVDVPADKVVDVVLDFDACKSVVKRGNTGKYNLKPVIAVIPVVNSGGQRVEGWIDPAMVGTSTLVSVQSQGLPVKTSIPDSTGRFVLFPVPVGSYSLVVTAPERATAVVTGVPVTADTVTSIGSTTVRMNPPASLMRDVNGTVSPATATVRATQSLSGGPTIEVASPAVDALDGTFDTSLPIAEPVRAPFVANAPSFGFVPDAPVAGRYTVQANSNGSIKNIDIDANSTVPPLTFTFP